MTQSTHTDDGGRRRFLRTTGLVAGSLALGGVATGTVAADASNNPAKPGRIYASDDLFATKGLTDLPPPNGKNDHSFDALYTFVTDGGPAPVDGQFSVAEAAPGEREFNGGRWDETLVAWAAGTTPVLLTNDDDVVDGIDAGTLVVVREDFHYFECPLVPSKD
ncbi:MAG: hypothetical protein ABEJ81_04595 [Haloferacaceae archaeon]